MIIIKCLGFLAMSSNQQNGLDCAGVQNKVTAECIQQFIILAEYKSDSIYIQSMKSVTLAAYKTWCLQQPLQICFGVNR